MTPDKCLHNKTWKERCRECEYISDLEIIRSFAPIVDNAMRRVNEYQKEKANESKGNSHA